MKNVNVLLAVVLCAGLCVLFGLFNRSADESLGWSPNEMYLQSILSSEGSSFTNANLSGSNVSNDGVAVSMRNGSFSLRTRARHTSSPNSLVANGVPGKSADFWGALSPNSPIASSPNSLIGHMTSSAEFRSFGGGSNMAMGSYTSSSNNLIASSPAIGSYSPSPIAYNPITSSPNNLIAYSPSNGEVQVSAEQALMSASSSAPGLFGSALQTTYGTASYDQTIYGSYGSTPSGIRGRQSASESDPWFSTMWWNWLDWQYNSDDETANGGWGTNKDGTWYFSYQDAEAAYNAWRNYMLNSGMVPNEDALPSYDDWLAWFMTTEDNPYAGEYGTYQFVPLGNVVPLLLLAFVYAVFIFIRRRLGVILEKSNS